MTATTSGGNDELSSLLPMHFSTGLPSSSYLSPNRLAQKYLTLVPEPIMPEEPEEIQGIRRNFATTFRKYRTLRLHLHRN